MNTLRRLRALGVVSAVWGLLAALLYVAFAWVTSLGGPTRAGIDDVLVVFGLAWVGGTVAGAIMGLALMGLARGRPLQRLRRWEPFVAGFAAGVIFLLVLLGIAGGLNVAEISMWGAEVLSVFTGFGAITGAYTLLFAEVARRGRGAVTAGVGDPAALPPA